VGLQLQRNGKPYKELVKIAHPRSFAVRTLPQPATERCVMSYVDVFYWGLLLVAFLGFAAALFYFWQRWSNRNPPTRLESKRFRRGENY